MNNLKISVKQWNMAKLRKNMHKLIMCDCFISRALALVSGSFVSYGGSAREELTGSAVNYLASHEDNVCVISNITFYNFLS